MFPLLSRKDGNFEKRVGKNGISYRVKITKNGRKLTSKSFPKFADAKNWIYHVELIKEDSVKVNKENSNDNTKQSTLHDLILRYTHGKRSQGKLIENQ